MVWIYESINGCIIWMIREFACRSIINLFNIQMCCLRVGYRSTGNISVWYDIK